MPFPSQEIHEQMFLLAKANVNYFISFFLKRDSIQKDLLGSSLYFNIWFSFNMINIRLYMIINR